MIKVAVCDDEKGFTSQIENIIKTIANDKGICIQIDVFFDGITLIEFLDSGKNGYDICFLDIEMDNMNGIETAQQIRKFDDNVLLFFVTSYDNYVMESFEVRPFQFLLKPLDKDKLSEQFMKAYEYIISEDYYYDYFYKRVYYRIPVKDILYFESSKRIIKIHKVDGTISTYYGKLSDIEDKLTNKRTDFWRIHQSILINSRYIIQKAYNHVIMKNQEKLFVSKERRREISLNYMKMMED